MAYLSAYLKASPSTRSLCTYLVALSHGYQVVIFLIVLLERYISIFYPVSHKLHITIGRIMVVQFGCPLLFSLLLVTKKYEAIEEYVMYQFFSSQIFKVIGTMVLGLLPVFLILQLGIMQIKTQKSYPPAEAIQLQSKRPDEGQSPTENQQKHYFVLIGNNRVSQIELEAYQNIFLMGKIFLAFTLLILISFGKVAVCLQQSETAGTTLLVGDTAQCSTAIQVFHYVSGSLLSFHSAFVNPFILIYSSSDFISVWKSFRNRFFCSRHRRAADALDPPLEYAEAYV